MNTAAANWEAQASLEGLNLPKQIGVCINFGQHIWYELQAENERAYCRQLGIKVDVVNAKMDAALQARQVSALIEAGAEALIFSAVDAAQAPQMLAQALARSTPVVTESIWIESPAVATNAMINEYKGGLKLGREAAAWLRLHSRSRKKLRVLDVTVPWLDEALQRSDGFLDGLRAGLPESEIESVRVDGRAEIETSARVSGEALASGQAFDIIFGVDDESAIGGRKGFEQAEIALDDVLICTFGFSGPQAYSWLTGGTYQIVCAMFPEYQAHMLIDAAIYAYNRRPLPRHLVAPCVALTAETLSRFYTRTPTGLALHLDAVRAISTTGEER